MSRFEETLHPRRTDGKFAAKGAAASGEPARVDLGGSAQGPDERARRLEAGLADPYVDDYEAVRDAVESGMGVDDIEHFCGDHPRAVGFAARAQIERQADLARTRATSWQEATDVVADALVTNDRWYFSHPAHAREREALKPVAHLLRKPLAEQDLAAVAALHADTAATLASRDHTGHFPVNGPVREALLASAYRKLDAERRRGEDR